jgi:hypothetical protein
MSKDTFQLALWVWEDDRVPDDIATLSFLSILPMSRLKPMRVDDTDNGHEGPFPI